MVHGAVYSRVDVVAFPSIDGEAGEVAFDLPAGETLVVSDSMDLLCVLRRPEPGANRPPRARITTDLPGRAVALVGEETFVELDALRSDYGDGGVQGLGHSWLQVYRPASAEIESPEAARTRGTLREDGVYIFALSVDDGQTGNRVAQSQIFLGVLSFRASAEREALESYEGVSFPGMAGDAALDPRDADRLYALIDERVASGGAPYEFRRGVDRRFHSGRLLASLDQPSGIAVGPEGDVTLPGFPFTSLRAMAVDPRSGHLWVAVGGGNELWSLDPMTGEAEREVLLGFEFLGNSSLPITFHDGALAFSADGGRLLLTDSANEGWLWLLAREAGPLPPEFRLGDANADGLVDIADAVAGLFYSFLWRGVLPCLDPADASDSGKVDFVDAVLILRYLFASGEPPPAPGPEACGPDPSADALSACGPDLACC